MTLHVDAGDVFEYDDPFNPTAAPGIGQIVGEHDESSTVFVRVLIRSGHGLMRLIDFLPLDRRAYAASSPRAVGWFDVPAECTPLQEQWRNEWISGRAGVFSIPLAEVRDKTLETVAHLSEFGDDEGAFIELAYPKLSPSGHFDTILAQVRTGHSRQP